MSKRSKTTLGDTDQGVKKSRSRWQWKELSTHNVFIGSRNKSSRDGLTRMAAFDFDSTLAVTVSGAVFPKNENDFKLLDDRLPALCKKVSQDHQMVIFTNQLGVLQKRITVSQVQERISGLLDLIDENMEWTVVVATGDNSYRKPRRGMFDLVSSPETKGFFVGDAAGRPSSKNKKKDHSNADFLFALNTGTLNFLTPEQFLDLDVKFSDLQALEEKIKRLHAENEKTLPLPSFSPRVELFCRNKFFAKRISRENETSFKCVSDLKTELNNLIKDNKKIVVVMTGLPGSGKSYFVKNLFSDFEVVSRDKLGSMDKCLRRFNEVVKTSSFKVVIDNTNTTLEHRKQWQCKTAFNISFLVKTPLDQCLHNNSFRRLIRLEREGQSPPTVPTFVLKKMDKELIESGFEEGFDCLIRLEKNIPVFEEASVEERLYFQFL